MANSNSGLPCVSIEVFAQISGLKADQLAGFKAWAKKNKLLAKTIPAWKLALTDYDNRPV